ncbi:hypothetical protein GQR58_012101 [Nymphon striatum]|nr:hypothetical protein GQR58_012101 [Nymphon striatum]
MDSKLSEEFITQLKKERKTAKCAVTRCVHKLACMQLKNDFDSFPSVYHDALSKFDALKEINDNLCDGDPDNYELYLEYGDKLHDEYVSTLLGLKNWHDGCASSVATAGIDNSAGSKQSNIPVENFSKIMEGICSKMNLPKYEIEKFNGDPLEYLIFKSHFKETILDNSYLKPDQKLSRLYHTLGHGPQQLIKCFLINKSQESLDKAIQLLDEIYGNPVKIAEMQVQGLINGNQVIDATDFTNLHAEMQSTKIVLCELNRQQELDNQRFILDIVNRIQPHDINEGWKNKARHFISEKNRYPTFDDLLSFIKQQSKWLNDVHYGTSQSKAQHPSATSHSNISHVTNNDHSPVSRQCRCLYCNSVEHLLYNCPKFTNLPVNDRVTFILKDKLCFNCITGKHMAKDCYSKFRCNICKGKHHRLLHGGFNRTYENINNNPDLNPSAHNFVPSSSSVANTITNNSIINKSLLNKTWFPLVKVYVHGHPAVALIDVCSTNSYVKSSFAYKVGLMGQNVSCVMNTLNGESQMDGKLYKVNVNYQDNRSILISAYGVKDIPVPLPTTNAKHYQHLHDLAFIQASDNSVDLLLGSDTGKIIEPIEIRNSILPHQPYAVRTELGWYVCGANNIENTKPSSSCDTQPNTQITHITCNTPTQADFELLWDQDQDKGPERSHKQSAEDVEVCQLWKREIRLVDGHLEVPIPLRKGVHFPPSRYMAENRLAGTTRRLKRIDMCTNYDEEVKKLLDEGYAEEVHNEEVDGGVTWCIPRRFILRKNGQIRIVFDCAAAVQNKSINTEICKRPDLNNSLLGCLLRFRLYKWATIGDIQSMYLQVKVPEDQRDLLRFLWYDYHNETEEKDVANIILKSFYVDDLLTSHQSSAELADLVERVIKHLASHGFNLRGIITNCKTQISTDETAEITREHGTLGINWNFKTDELSIKVKDIDSSTVTKRSILSSVARTFDPLGLVSPNLLTGRLILKDVVCMGVEWDEPLSEAIGSRWKHWLLQLNILSSFKIPRYVHFDDKPAEIHTFVDASDRVFDSGGFVFGIFCVLLYNQTPNSRFISTSLYVGYTGLVVLTYTGSLQAQWKILQLVGSSEMFMLL